MRAAPWIASPSSMSSRASASRVRSSAPTRSETRARATGTPSRSSRTSTASSSASPRRRRYEGSSGERASSWSPVASRSWIRSDSYPAARSSRASSTAASGLSVRGGPGRRGGGTARTGSTAAGAPLAPLERLLRLQVEPELAARGQGAVGFLLLVLDLDLGEVEGHLVGRDEVAVLGSARLERADEDVVELERQVVLLVLPGLTACERGHLDVLPRCASLHEGRARAVQPHHEVEVLHRDLAGGCAATRLRANRAHLAPAPGLDVDL